MGRPTGSTSVLQMPRIAFAPATKDNPPPKSFAPSAPPPPTATSDSPWVAPCLPHAPQSWPAPKPHTGGLDNLGNTCFLNSALQCLLHCPPLASLLLLSTHTKHARPGPFCAYCSLERLATTVHSGARTVAPRQLASNCRALLSTFRVGQQEDAHEFVRALLEAMSRAELLGCGRPPVKRLSLQREMSGSVHRVFGGLLQSSVTCTECRYVSCTFEPFLDLSLEISAVASLPRALARFTAAESLGGDNKYRCDGCKRLVAATKRFSIRRAPNVLTLHLKRFDRSRKDSRHISYPETLDLAPFMHGRPSDINATYKLSGVLIHQGGSRQYGHYLAYVKGSNGTWCLKDDSTSRTVPLSTALKQKAYVLFYTRVATDVETTGVSKPCPNPVSVTKTVPIESDREEVPVAARDSFPGAHLTSNGANADKNCTDSSEDESYHPMSESSDGGESEDPSSSASGAGSPERSAIVVESRTAALAQGTKAEVKKRVATSVPELSDSEVETEPSDPISADDDESHGSGAVRSILIGGGDAVRKVIQRVFGVSNSGNGRTERKKGSAQQSASSSPTSSRKGSPKQSRFGKRAAKSETKSTDTASSFDGKRISDQSANSSESSGSSGSLDRKNSPRMFRIGKRGTKGDGKDDEPSVSFGDIFKRKGTSTLFRSEGVDKWDDAVGSSSVEEDKVRLQKRGRVDDALDAEYDRGKAKKIRQRSTNGSGGLHAWNVFDRAAERKRS